MKAEVLGIGVENATMEEALRLLEGWMTRQDRTRTVYFVNAHTLNLASADPSYRAVLRRADVVFGDGTGVRWAARLRGVELRDNVNGTDLTPALLSGTAGYRLYVLGADPSGNARAAEYLRRSFPGWEVVDHQHGYFHESELPSVLEDIRRSRPHLLLVGMGNPLQERWIDRYRARLEVPVVMGVGGLLDYYSGRLVRAPTWVRELGMEWVHILRLQPHKAGRYVLGNPVFLVRALTDSLSDGRTS